MLLDYEQQNAYSSLTLIVTAFHVALYKIPKTRCLFINSKQEKLWIPRNLVGSQRKRQ